MNICPHERGKSLVSVISLSVGLGRLAEQELPYHLFQHEGRIGFHDFIAIFQHRLIAARRETDILLSDESGRKNTGKCILWELVTTVYEGIYSLI